MQAPGMLDEGMTMEPYSAEGPIGQHYTVREIAALLGMTERYIRKLVADGDLPAYKIGRSVRVPAESLSAFLDARKLMPKRLATLHVAS